MGIAARGVEVFDLVGLTQNERWCSRYTLGSAISPKFNFVFISDRKFFVALSAKRGYAGFALSLGNADADLVIRRNRMDQLELEREREMGLDEELPKRKPANFIYLFSDDAHFLSELSTALLFYDYEVLGYSDAESFMSAVLTYAPAAVILDIDSDPGEQLRTSVAQAEEVTCPVLYVSAHDEFDSRLNAVREGVDAYFLKPVDVQALSHRIDENIASAGARAYRILIVDDDEFFLSFFESILSSAGMHVRSLLDPTKTLDAIKKFNPELLLTDLHMPQCSGVELAKVIRQNNRYVDLPIVFLSCETAIQKQLGALQSGADDFLTKPIDPEKLVASIAYRAERYRNLRKSM